MSKPFNIHDWQAKQRLAENYSDKEESMSNEDIAALERIVKKYNMGKIQNIIKIFADRMNELNTTGTGASFQAGNSAAYATPKAFKKKRKRDLNEVSYSDFKRNTESSPRQKIARGIRQVNRMIKEIEKIVAHNFRLKTELDMNSGTFLRSTNKQIHEIGARLKQLDNKNLFYADDEIGFFFKEVQKIQEALNEFTLK